MPRDRVAANRSVRWLAFAAGNQRGQLFQALDIDGGERVADKASGNAPAGGNFGKRQQHKSPLEQMRMRQRQIRLAQRYVVISKDVDVDRPRPPSPFTGAVAPERKLDTLRAREQRPRVERSRH